MNYCTLDEIKSELNITSDAYDDIIMLDIEAVKISFDSPGGRSFDTVATTKYYDGTDSTLYIDDLVSITGENDGIFLDEDGDRAYEVTLASTDYILYPLNRTPKTKVIIDTINGTYSSFAWGIKQGVKITATWGYQSTVPADIKKVAIIQACRWFKRKDSAFQDAVGSPETGELLVYKSLDPDVKLVLDKYREIGV